ncbi:MAG: glycosyltransferase family 4 protein [Chloroflexi bacterium]|nr:glycosyltransferase family 4 protein [Chloroflexota bacterium]
MFGSQCINREIRYNLPPMDKILDEQTRPLRLCFFGTYRANYVRNQVIIAGLRQNGAIVEECHSPLWHSVADRVAQAGGGWKSPRFFKRVIKAYWRLFQAHRHTPEYDIMLVGYPGQFDVYLGRLLSWWRRKPMALDILMSLHLIAEERGLAQKSPISGKLIFWLEKGSLKLPDLLIADTPEYREYYCEKYDLKPEKFSLVPLGVDDRIYRPRPDLRPPQDYFRIIYYGTFIPLHGVETMIRAAAALQDQPQIQFDFYGDGQERPSAEQLARELNLDNVHFRGWIDKEELPAQIAQSHVVLGVFGTTKQSRCTIQNKIWEGMMMQRPVISGDAETIQAELKHKKHVYLVERANPQALAAGILELAQTPDLRRQMAIAAFERVQENTIAAIGAKTKELLSVWQNEKQI